MSPKLLRRLLALYLACISLPVQAELQPEPLTTHTYPEMSPHRVHVLTYEGVMDRYFVVDGDSGEVLGIVPGAMNSVLRIGADGHFYSADTYYEKIWRGKRTDQITVFDGTTGMISKEIDIPAKRFHAYSLNSTVDFTEGGRYLLQYNMTPAASVTVVDTRTGTVLPEIPTAGCGLVFPYAPTAFAMLCADGGLLRVSFDEAGTARHEQLPPFFDPENDPVLQNSLSVPELDLALFLTYEGVLHEVALADKKPFNAKPWSLRGEGEDDWFPSGWQPLAYSAKLDLIFAVMKQTVKWDHTAGGHEVWAFDRKTRQRRYRVDFAEPIAAIAVSPDQDAQLYALTNENDTIVYVLDAATGELQREVSELGSYPFTLMAVPAHALK